MLTGRLYDVVDGFDEETVNNPPRLNVLLSVLGVTKELSGEDSISFGGAAESGDIGPLLMWKEVNWVVWGLIPKLIGGRV